MNCLPIFARKNLLLILSLFLLNQSPRILAQETQPVNPLTTNFSHELLPRIDRNLTSFEENRINEKIIESSDAVLEIPQYGTKHSFNISVSIGIVLWDFYSKGLKDLY